MKIAVGGSPVIWSNAVSLFHKKLAFRLDHCDICYALHAKFTEKSGKDCSFDFAMPQSKTLPELVLCGASSSDHKAMQATACFYGRIPE